MSLDQPKKAEPPEVRDQVKEASQKLNADASLSEEAAKLLSSKTEKPALMTGQTELSLSLAKAPLSIPAELPGKGLELQTGANKLNLLSSNSSELLKQTKSNYYSSKVTDAISSTWARLSSIGSSGTFSSMLGYMANPVSGAVSLGSKLIKVAENVYQSSDKKLTVSKIAGEAAHKLKDDWDKAFNSDEVISSKAVAEKPQASADKLPEAKIERVSSVDDPSNLPKELLGWLYDKNEKPSGAAVSDNLFGYVSETGEKTEITATPGHVHIEKRDKEGNLRTIVDKTDGKTVVLQDKESVVIEDGKQVVKGPGYKITWDEAGKRHITLDNGDKIERENGTLKIISAGQDLTVRKHELESTSGNFSYTDASADNLRKLIEDKRKELKEGEVSMLAIRGSGLATIFEDGSTFFVKGDKAKLETKDKQVLRFEIKDDQLFINKGGQLIAIDSKDSPVQNENGKFRIGKLLIDPRELRMQTCDTDKSKFCKPMTVDLRTGHQQWLNDLGHTVDAWTKDDGSTKIQDGPKTFENNPFDANVKIANLPVSPDAALDAATNTNASPSKSPEESTINVNLDTLKVETKELIDEPAKTFIKESKTVIKEDKTVEFENGPKVKPDGSVYVDKDTYVTHDNTVHSRGWVSNAAQKSHYEISEANAKTIASNISAKASSLSNLAKAGTVKWTDLAALNSALGDVLSLMSSLPPSSPAYAMLAASYRIIVEAINQATPKAQKAEQAESAGIHSKDGIKQVQEGLSPEQIKRENSGRFIAA